MTRGRVDHRAPADRGYHAVGIIGGKTPENLGTLWRSATLYGAAFVFTVGKRYGRAQASDTTSTARHVPLFHFADIDDLVEHLPYGCPLVGVELDPRARPLTAFTHPERAAYLLGAEDNGLTPEQRDRCHHLVEIESALPWSMNVAAAGTVLLHHRLTTRVPAKVPTP